MAEKFVENYEPVTSQYSVPQRLHSLAYEL